MLLFSALLSPLLLGFSGGVLGAKVLKLPPVSEALEAENSPAYKSRAVNASSFPDVETQRIMERSNKTAHVYGRTIKLGAEWKVGDKIDETDLIAGSSWEEVPSNNATLPSTWRFVIQSQGAFSHTVLFKSLHIPPSALLYVYGLDSKTDLPSSVSEPDFFTAEELVGGAVCEENPGCEVIGKRKIGPSGMYASIPIAGDLIVIHYVSYARSQHPEEFGNSTAPPSLLNRIMSAVGARLFGEGKGSPTIKIEGIVQGFRPVNSFSTTAPRGAAIKQQQKSQELNNKEQRRLVAVRKLSVEEAESGVHDKDQSSMSTGMAPNTEKANPWWILGSIGSSGRCNVPVQCAQKPQLEAFSDEKQAVVQLMINGPSKAAMCTGTLLNNPQGRNFILTAHHCFDNDLRPGTLDYPFVNIVFNYEAKDCETGIVPPVRHVLYGSKLIWFDEDSDMILLELNEPIGQVFNAYRAGWTIETGTSGAAPKSGTTTIHHPSGDAKKISSSSRRTYSSSAKSFTVVYDQGTTEPGSSGGPLFDSATGEVIGALSGGTASCEEPNGSDVFIKLSYGWSRGLGDHLGVVNGTISGKVTKMSGVFVADGVRDWKPSGSSSPASAQRSGVLLALLASAVAFALF